MRSSAVLTAAFAGCALSSPLVKRDLVQEIDTVFDVVFTTAFETVTAGASPVAQVTSSTVVPSVESSATTSAPVEVKQNDFFNNRHSYTWAWATTVQSVATSAAAASTEAASSVVVSSVAPVSTSAPVIESTSVYVAPSTSFVTSSSAPASTSSAAETSTAASSKATTYQQRVLVHHNVHRANHSASALTWNQTLADTATKIAKSCNYAHNVQADGGGYGQNIAAGVQAANISAVITDLFYNGEVNYFNGLYGQANPSMTNFENWGHFSQIVWKDTTTVGCATVDCSSSGLSNTGSYVAPYFTVCNYGPPGNYGGEYADNIGKSLNRATVGWSYGL